jgi:colanic acid/amylovoran biosynthesis glycosyltransferase
LPAQYHNNNPALFRIDQNSLIQFTAVKNSAIWRQREEAWSTHRLKSDQTVDGSLLLDLPGLFRLHNGTIQVEAQAQQGIFRWLENFPVVSVCAPVVPEDHISSSTNWVPVTSVLETGRLSIHPLPWGYHPRQHLRGLRKVRALFRELIPKHQYLHFSNLGWFGAWGRIGAEEARRLSRPYAVWLDWVIHEMPIRREGNLLKRTWQRTYFELAKRGSLHDIKRAGLGLFHGSTVYQSYAPYSSLPKIVHDVHLDEEDILREEALEARLNSVRDRVSILYVGRVHEMKGPRQWLDTVEQVIRTASPGQPRVEAKWYGDGPAIEELRDLVNRRGLSDCISFPGNVSARSEILDIFRAADLFVFCHLTPESPRCLIEALMCGLPILGFESAYANALTSPYGGGATVPMGDVGALAEIVKKYVSDKDARNNLSRAGLHSGKQFSEQSVFRRRSELIKQFL